MLDRFLRRDNGDVLCTRERIIRLARFEDEIFGLEKPMQQIVEYFHSAVKAACALKERPMHEEPQQLIPHEQREDVEKEFGLYIEGDLCPQCHWLLDNKYGGKIEDGSGGMGEG